MQTTVNLRAPGTDMSNPKAGTLVGTAEVLIPLAPDDAPLPPLVVAFDFAPGAHRYFVLAKGTFAYGGSVPAEYVEVVPVAVKVTDSAD